MTNLRSIVGLLCLVVSSIFASSLCMALSFVSRRLGHATTRMWARQLLWIFGVRVQTAGLENLSGGRRRIFVANHQSDFDIPVLFSVVPHNLVFLAKKELFLIPIFGWGIALMGHVKIDRSSARKARESFTTATQRLKTEDISLVIFPEGTRSRTGDVGPFKRGTFALAVEAGLEVIPVAIKGTYKILRKGSILPRPGSVEVSFGPPIDPASFGSASTDKEALATRVREVIVGMMGNSSDAPGARA